MDRRQAVDALIDRFVERVNRSPRQRIREEDVPLPLRHGGAEFGLYYSWTIQPFRHTTWIEPLESKLPAPLPPSYRSLVKRYIFPAFQVQPLVLLANTGHALYNELGTAIFRDKILSQVLLKKGYMQFARPHDGDCDPICFDLNRGSRVGEYPLVRVDHEQVLFNGAVKVTEEIAPSFFDFVVRYIRTDLRVARPSYG